MPCLVAVEEGLRWWEGHRPHHCGELELYFLLLQGGCESAPTHPVTAHAHPLEEWGGEAAPTPAAGQWVPAGVAGADAIRGLPAVGLPSLLCLGESVPWSFLVRACGALGLSVFATHKEPQGTPPCCFLRVQAPWLLATFHLSVFMLQFLVICRVVLL